MEKPSPDLEKNLQKYFKLAAIIILGFVIWKTFSTSSSDLPYQVVETAEQQEQRLKKLITEAVDETLNKRQLESKTPYITELDNGYEIFVPKANISENASLSTSQGIFEINFKASVQPPLSNSAVNPSESGDIGPSPAVYNGGVNAELPSEKDGGLPSNAENNNGNLENSPKNNEESPLIGTPSETPAQ